MDLLFEFIIELLVELATGDYTSDIKMKLSKPVKIIILIVLVFLYIGLIAFIAWAAIGCWNKGKHIMFATLVVADLFILFGVIRMLVKAYRRR